MVSKTAKKLRGNIVAKLTYSIINFHTKTHYLGERRDILFGFRTFFCFFFFAKGKDNMLHIG